MDGGQWAKSKGSAPILSPRFPFHTTHKKDGLPSSLSLFCVCLRGGSNRGLGLGRVSFPSMIATWLILPVVIRSSQRLSHACLSINNSIL